METRNIDELKKFFRWKSLTEYEMINMLLSAAMHDLLEIVKLLIAKGIDVSK